jgi:alkylation response protein AidB-like acyl-CoA dehydrogenase
MGPEGLLLRLLTPILKLFTGKTCMGLISEALESFGALGYMEDSHIPVIMRDA